MKHVGKSHLGLKRKNNQDSFTILSRGGYISAVVCDGMGGAKGGNVASKIAAKAYTQSIKSALSKVTADSLTIPEATQIINSAVKKANTLVFEAANYDMDLEGMGTTLVAALVCGQKVFVVNVGDSRFYTYKDGNIAQITEDHSFVQYLLDKGSITREEAMNHPSRSIILRALGVNETVETDVFVINEEDYDLLMLCSDGLTSHVTDQEISDILKTDQNRPSLRKRLKTLIDTANQKGGADNITVILLEK